MRHGLTISDLAMLGSAASAGPTSPDQLAGLVRWYKADSFSLADGTDIGDTGTEWLDQSPTAPNNATQSDPTRRPVFHTNIFGSMPGIEFISANIEWLSMPNLTLAGDFTIIAIAKVTAQSVLLAEALGAFKTLMFRLGVNTVVFRDGGADIISDAFSEVQTNVRMITWRRSSDVISFRESTVARGTTIDPSGVVSFTYDGIGLSDGGATRADGHYGEICVFNQHVSDANVDSLYENYFKTRWGLA